MFQTICNTFWSMRPRLNSCICSWKKGNFRVLVIRKCTKLQIVYLSKGLSYGQKVHSINKWYRKDLNINVCLNNSVFCLTFFPMHFSAIYYQNVKKNTLFVYLFVYEIACIPPTCCLNYLDIFSIVLLDKNHFFSNFVLFTFYSSIVCIGIGYILCVR